MPEQYWRLTPKETMYLLQGHYLRDMQLASLLAAFLNVNRDPKKSRPVKAEDVSVFRQSGATPPEQGEQTPEQQRAILEALTLVMGGEVTKHG